MATYVLHLTKSCTKQSSRESKVTTFETIVAFFLMSVMSRSLPLRVVILFGNIKKSAGMRSGE